MNISMILSPKMAKSLMLLDSQRWATVSYKRDTCCIELLRHLCTYQLMRGKRILVVTGDNHHSEKLEHELSSMGISDLLLNLSNKNSIDLNLLDLEKILRSRSVESVDLTFLQLMQKNTTISYEALKKAYQTLRRPIFDKTNWQQLVDFKALMERSEWNNPLHNKLDSNLFEWNSKEYLEISKIIKYKAYSYKFHFNSLVLIDPFTSAFYNSIETDQELDIRLEQINVALEKLYTLKDTIADHKQRQLAINYADICLNNNEIKNHTTCLISEVSTYQYLIEKNKKVQGNNLFSFDSNPIKKQLQGLKKTIEDRLIAIHTSQRDEKLDIDEILTSNDYVQILNNHLEIFQKELNLELGSTNTSLDIDLFIDEMNAICEPLNKEKHFTHVFDCAPFDIDDLIEYTDWVIQYLMNGSQFIINNDDYIQYHILLEKDETKIKTLISSLTNHDSEDWETIFENWYLLQLVTSNYNHEFPEEFDTGSYQKALSEESEVLVKYLQFYWKNQMLWANKTFQEEFSELKRLQKATAKSIHVDISLESWGKLISNYYPVIVVPESSFEENSSLTRNWDTVIYVDCEKSIRQDVPYRQYVINALTLKDPEEDAIVLPQWGNQLVYYTEEDFLNQIKYIAKEIATISTPTGIWVNDENVIISYWTDAKNKILMDALASKNYREVQYHKDNDNQIVDLLLSKDKKIHLLTQDGLFDLENKNLKWQFQFLIMLENIGVNLVNVWSKEYFIYGKELITSLLIQEFDSNKLPLANEDQAEIQIDAKEEANPIVRV